MDNLVNSLVTKTIGLTDQQVKDKLLASPNMNDAQLSQFMQTNGVSPSQMSLVSGIPVGQVAARVAATIPYGSSAIMGDTILVPQYRETGSGMDQQIGGLEGFAMSKTTGDPNYKAPVGTPMQMYGADGTFTGTVLTKKDQSFFGGIKEALKDPYVQAAILGAVGGATGLFSSAPAGATVGSIGAGGATALEGASALGSLGTLGTEAAVAGMGTGTGLTAAGAGGLGGATGAAGLGGLGAGVGAGVGGMAATNSLLGNAALGSTLANTATGLTGTALGALGNAGGSLLGGGAATSALGTTLGQGLALNALGSGLGAVANQSGINNARDLISQYGNTANTQLNTAYTDAKALNAANNATLASNYTNLGTNLQNNLDNQFKQYGITNTNLNANAADQLALLKTNLANQTAQANANASALNTNYGNARGDLYDIYNQQVGIQSPYQTVGQAGAKGLTDNQSYLTRQFGAADLNEQLAPNYAFQLAQGQMANQRAANMGGGSLGGNALRGLQDYTQNYASGAYQNAFNNFNTQRQNIYSTLAGMANIGTTSGGQLASLGNTMGGNLGSLSSNLGGNLTSNTGNLLNAGTAYGSNTANVSNNLNNALTSNFGQMSNAFNQYGSNLTGASNTYGGNLTTGAGQGINAANLYGANSANLATGIGSALAGNASASGANTATALSNLGNTALLGSMLRAT